MALRPPPKYLLPDGLPSCHLDEQKILHRQHGKDYTILEFFKINLFQIVAIDRRSDLPHPNQRLEEQEIRRSDLPHPNQRLEEREVHQRSRGHVHPRTSERKSPGVLRLLNLDWSVTR